MGRRLVRHGTHDPAERLWDPTTGIEVGCLTGHECPVLDVEFLAGGTRVAAASGDGTVRIWDVRSKQQELCLRSRPSKSLLSAASRFFVGSPHMLCFPVSLRSLALAPGPSSWGPCPQTPRIYRFTARAASATIPVPLRRIGLRWEPTRAPRRRQGSRGRFAESGRPLCHSGRCPCP